MLRSDRNAVSPGDGVSDAFQRAGVPASLVALPDPAGPRQLRVPRVSSELNWDAMKVAQHRPQPRKPAWPVPSSRIQRNNSNGRSGPERRLLRMDVTTQDKHFCCHVSSHPCRAPVHPCASRGTRQGIASWLLFVMAIRANRPGQRTLRAGVTCPRRRIEPPREREAQLVSPAMLERSIARALAIASIHPRPHAIFIWFSYEKMRRWGARSHKWLNLAERKGGDARVSLSGVRVDS